MTTDNHATLSGTMPTRSARDRIIAAFNAMVLKRQRGPYRVGTIIRHARVARSTFYDHFASESALQLTALNMPFAAMADALSGRGNVMILARWLTHFWDYRQQARPLLDGAERPRIERMFFDLMAERLYGDADNVSADRQMAALQIAAATMATMDRWLKGRLPVSSDTLAGQLVEMAAAIRGATSPR